MSTFNYRGLPVDLIGDFELTLLNNRERDGGGSWLIDTFFARKKITSENVLALGSLNMTVPLAPYVSPCVEGRPVRASGTGSVDFIKFAYVKPKMAIEPCKSVDSVLLNQLRDGGMTISQRMSQSEAIQIDQLQKTALMKRMLDSRVQQMAAEVFTTGKVIVMSDDHPLYEADFGRSPAANFVPAIPWNLATSTPVQDIETMSNLSFDLTGNYGRILVMRTKVWKSLVKHNDFNDTYVKPYSGIRNPLEGTVFNKSDNQANFKLKLDDKNGNGLEVWTYDGFYTDSTGTRKFFLPDNYCGLVSSTDGIRAFGKIEDIDANYEGYEYYAKTWKQADPSLLFVMLQAAPMVVPAGANMVIGGNGFVS
jgi:hypothetical protein